MSFLLERDALNGKSGSGFLKINGENHQMFGMKKIPVRCRISGRGFQGSWNYSGADKNDRGEAYRNYDFILWITIFFEASG